VMWRRFASVAARQPDLTN